MDLVASNYCHVKIDGEKMTTWRFITGDICFRTPATETSAANQVRSVFQ